MEFDGIRSFAVVVMVLGNELEEQVHVVLRVINQQHVHISPQVRNI